MLGRVRRGGLHQQLRRQQEERAEAGGVPREERVGPSKLAEILLLKWAWGSMSLPSLQVLAAAAVHDGVAHPLLRWEPTRKKFPPVSTELIHTPSAHPNS